MTHDWHPVQTQTATIMDTCGPNFLVPFKKFLYMSLKLVCAFPSIWILCTDVSESVPSSSAGTCEEFVTPTCLWRWNRQSVPKCRHTKFGHRGITQKKAYNIQNGKSFKSRAWNCFLISSVCNKITGSIFFWRTTFQVLHSLFWGQYARNSQNRTQHVGQSIFFARTERKVWREKLLIFQDELLLLVSVNLFVPPVHCMVYCWYKGIATKSELC